jgi:hypothetical protein
MVAISMVLVMLADEDNNAVLVELLAALRTGEARRTAALRRHQAAHGRTRGEGKTVFSWVTGTFGKYGSNLKNHM